MATEAADAPTNVKLITAAKAYLAGDAKALDPGFMAAAFTAYVRAGGLPAGKMLIDRALASEDAVLCGSALLGVSSAGRGDAGTWPSGCSDSMTRACGPRRGSV